MNLKEIWIKTRLLTWVEIKLLVIKKPIYLHELVNKSYVDQKVQAGASVDLS